MATSLDALEALLQIREGPSKVHIRSRMPHVPNPLDPAQPHFIEGDTPAAADQVAGQGSGAHNAFSLPPMTPAVTSVPDPLIMPRTALNQCSSPSRAPATIALASASSYTAGKIPCSHGFSLNSPTPMSVMSSSTPARPCEAEVRSDIVRDALNSKPQRGKKRHNLSDLEREELTRTRNRQHAKMTR